MNKHSALLQLLNINDGEDLIFLLGAGCSISSGCLAAKKLVYEFKKRIYCADKSIRIGNGQMMDEIRLEEDIRSYFDDHSISNPYSYYFSKCFPDYIDRNIFIKTQFQDKKPSLGYLCFANYLISKKVRCVLTTNFDNLIEAAIHKIDDTYDFTNISENQQPILSSTLNIIKVHGDYKYDAIRNTEAELVDIENNLKEKLLRIPSRKIIVIGYSGMDKSVMGFLNTYLDNNTSTQLIWCGIEEELNNDMIKSLLNKGRDSYYQVISGFDSLFENYYKTFGPTNEVIENISSNILNSAFAINVSNQPERFITNSFEIVGNPLVYRSAVSRDYDYSTRDRNGVFSLLFKNDIFSIARSYADLGTGSFVELNNQDIPLLLKCKLLKEVIKLAVSEKGILVYRDNLYIDNKESIKCGLKINIDLIDRKICLILNVNYFVVTDNCSPKEKYEINHKKSLLYTKQNYQLLNELIKKILPSDKTFKVGKTIFSFTKNSLVSSDFADYYECRKEPIMIGNNMESTNQLKIINTNGPRETLFSLDNIKVGIFCCEESKPQLRQFVSQIVNGDKGLGISIVPQFKGFERIFHKKITFEFDALPPFYEHQIMHKDIVDVIAFYSRGLKRMYDEKQIDLALIYFSNNMTELKDKDGIDFHNVLKVASANRYKTQFLEEKTINSNDNRSKILFNLSTAIYTKTIGMPWYPKSYSKGTLFLGMSFGCDATGITVGCSQMFDGAGRGMQLIVSRISDKKKKNQYLNKDEAFELGKKIRQTYYKSSKIEELNRVVIHRNDPFKKEEIEGFKMAFEGIDDFDLIQLSDDSKFNVYPVSNNNECNSYPIKRGTIIKTSNNIAYLWTDGSVNDSDVLPTKTYRNNTRGMSSPLKIIKHYGNVSINDASDDLLILTKMDFNSADVLYSKLPVTIKYSRIVCDMIKQKNFSDDLISFEFIM